MSTPARAVSASVAFDAGDLYARHSRLVVAICRSLLRDADEAEDAAQQTFLAAHRALLGGTRPRDAESWLAAIARNECRRRIRLRMASPTTAPLDEELDGRGDTTHDAAVGGAAIRELRAAVAALPERQREALLLREVRGLSYEEVAEEMAVTPPAVETLLWRARRHVAARLRAVPALGAALKELALRIGGPADAGTAGALAAKAAAAAIAAGTATSAAVEVERWTHGKDERFAVPAVGRAGEAAPSPVSRGRRAAHESFVARPSRGPGSARDRRGDHAPGGRGDDDARSGRPVGPRTGPAAGAAATSSSGPGPGADTRVDERSGGATSGSSSRPGSRSGPSDERAGGASSSGQSASSGPSAASSSGPGSGPISQGTGPSPTVQASSSGPGAGSTSGQGPSSGPADASSSVPSSSESSGSSDSGSGSDDGSDTGSGSGSGSGGSG